MNYIIYDLEFNQKSLESAEDQYDNSSRLPFEIIQIGALKLNEGFETVSNFNALIKPNVYPDIHPFVEKLTKINKDAVSSSKSFPEVYEDFLKFVGDEEIVFCVWGTVDIKELLRNIGFYNLSTASKSINYIDIQKYASKYFKAPQSRIGLATAIDLLNLKTDGEFHDAFNDAYYTAEVFKSIYNDSLKPQTYVTDFPKAVQKRKEKIDTTALINQFEKMHDREMSMEEKAIIMLAYNMGRTRQFLIQFED